MTCRLPEPALYGLCCHPSIQTLSFMASKDSLSVWACRRRSLTSFRRRISWWAAAMSPSRRVTPLFGPDLGTGPPALACTMPAASHVCNPNKAALRNLASRHELMSSSAVSILPGQTRMCFVEDVFCAGCCFKLQEGRMLMCPQTLPPLLLRLARAFPGPVGNNKLELHRNRSTSSRMSREVSFCSSCIQTWHCVTVSTVPCCTLQMAVYSHWSMVSCFISAEPD